MRTAALVGLALVLFASHAAAQQTPYRAVVSDPEVKVRAVPSDRLDDTGTLPRGAVVVVEREEPNGWLAITAPYGSVSWIAAAFVEDLAPDKPTPKNGFVNTEGEVTLAAGKAGLAQPLDIRREKVPQGTAVLILGPQVKFGGKNWYPIAPPAGDVRYIPKTAVQFEKPAANNFVVRVNESVSPVPPAAGPSPSPSVGPIATIPGPGGDPAPAGGVVSSKPAVSHPLWQQAETAERENRLADAEKAYFDLAALMNGPGGDHDIANLCYTRIHALRERKRTGNTTSGTTGGALPAKEDRGVRPGAPQALPPAAGSNVNAKTDGGPSGEKQEWVGTLRISALTLDGIDRKTYLLETSPGVVKGYVLAGAGVDLARHVGKRVSVSGVPQTRSGLSKPYVVATAVEGQ